MVPCSAAKYSWRLPSRRAPRAASLPGIKALLVSLLVSPHHHHVLSPFLSSCVPRAALCPVGCGVPFTGDLGEGDDAVLSAQRRTLSRAVADTRTWLCASLATAFCTYLTSESSHGRLRWCPDALKVCPATPPCSTVTDSNCPVQRRPVDQVSWA